MSAISVISALSPLNSAAVIFSNPIFSSLLLMVINDNPVDPTLPIHIFHAFLCHRRYFGGNLAQKILAIARGLGWAYISSCYQY